MLSQSDIAFYREHGYLRIPRVFSPAAVQAMRDDLHWMIEQWAECTQGWSGPWRKQYMDEQTEKASQLVHMHDLHLYSEAWMRAVTSDTLCDAMADLLDGCVELHHSTMHVKPPESGHPFPMHQDHAFYQHEDDRFIDVLVHLDDTRHENGEIRFLAGSHRQGPLDHVTADPATGEPCTPHLPTDAYALADTVAVPAEAGDVVIFNIWTVHGSHINRTDAMRRMVRVGYKHPANRQLAGQSIGRPGLMVRGRRPRLANQPLFGTAGPDGAAAEQFAVK